MTFDEVKQYLDLIRAGEGLNRAARRINVDPKLMRENRHANPEFEAMVRQAEIEAAEPVENALYQAALAGEPWAVKLWLERRSPDRWQPAPATLNINLGVAPEVGHLLELQAALEQRRALMMPEVLELEGEELPPE